MLARDVEDRRGVGELEPGPPRLLVLDAPTLAAERVRLNESVFDRRVAEWSRRSAVRDHVYPFEATLVDLGVVIVSLHVATGAALGALTHSRIAALALGPPLHLACDRVPRQDIDDRRFEIRSGVFGMALLALSRGPLEPATLGAASACAPDLEHIFRPLRPRGRKLFHGRLGWHRSGGFRADVQ